VGGAGAWGENGTMIWGTDALTPHFFKQYGQFRKVRMDLPCFILSSLRYLAIKINPMLDMLGASPLCVHRRSLCAAGVSSDRMWR
jgi:hypothetical protein